jgi:hypothetical protein
MVTHVARLPTYVLAITFGVVAALHAPPALACRCREPGTTSAAYARAALVVEAQVVGVEARPDIAGSVVKLNVAHAWKADTAAQISFTTGSDCRYDTAAGQAYLLFLVKTPAGELTTGRCMGNGTTLSKQRALAWLNKLGRRSKITPAPPSGQGGQSP